MNILYLTTHLNIGGITSYVLSLASGLKTRGHNVFIASSEGNLTSRFIQEGIVCVSIPIKTKQEFNIFKILPSLFKLLEFVKEENINIIHSNTRVTQVLGCLIKRFSGKAHISTCHGFFKRRFSRKIFPCWGNKVIAISESVKEHLVRDFGIEEQDIRVIHSGIDVDRFRVSDSDFKIKVKKSLGLSDGPVVGIIARLSEEKGHIYLIEAMREIINKIPQTQLLIIGDGRTKDRLLNLTQSLSLEKSIFFMPSVSDTKDALSVMDIFVLPSLKEGLGLSLMEAMARGCAVIGSSVGGIRNLIQDGYNGLLVGPADARRLSLVILELLQDAQKREFLGNNAQVFIEQNFSLSGMVLQTEKLYSECLNVKD